MTNETREVLEALKADTSSAIVPAVYSFCFPRAAVSSAFKIALRDGLIKVSHKSSTGQQVYTKGH